MSAFNKIFLSGFFVALLLSFTSCVSIKQSPKYELKDGIYGSSLISKKGNKIYLEMHEDTIQAFAANKIKDSLIVVKEAPIALFPQTTRDQVLINYWLYKPSFDLDFITIPVKYRSVSEGFPRQLNSSVSGAFYIGARYDLYKINYSNNALNIKEREINHYGFSVGGFGGLGSAFINPWVTGYRIDSEYDGVVFNYGIAAVLGLNQFTAGMAIGFDNLTDKNKSYWIYQNKLWVGLVIGLSLN